MGFLTVLKLQALIRNNGDFDELFDIEDDYPGSAPADFGAQFRIAFII
jgi:hypothetical protein